MADSRWQMADGGGEKERGYVGNHSRVFSLTAREKEVLALVVEGMSNPEIAGALRISRKTVKAHVSNILGKMGVSSRREIRLMVENGNNGLKEWGG